MSTSPEGEAAAGTLSQADELFISSLREHVVDVDVQIVGLLNRRLELIAQLMNYKRRHGIPLVDRDREIAVLGYLSRVNGGPLSGQGLKDFYEHLLSLVKREVLGDLSSSKPERAADLRS